MIPYGTVHDVLQTFRDQCSLCTVPLMLPTVLGSAIPLKEKKYMYIFMDLLYFYLLF